MLLNSLFDNYFPIQSRGHHRSQKLAMEETYQLIRVLKENLDETATADQLEREVQDRENAIQQIKDNHQ